MPAPERMSPRPSRKRAPRSVLSAARREWTIASDVQAITAIVETVQGMCSTAGFSASQCRLNLPVAVTEALSNAILRGNAGVAARRVHIAVELDAARLIVDVTDEGVGFDLDAIRQGPDESDWLDREDGRGLFLMRSLMDRIESRRWESAVAHETRGHTLRLILHRA